MGLRKLAKPHDVGHRRPAFPDPLGRFLLGDGKFIHEPMIGLGLLQGVQILPLDVFDEGHFQEFLVGNLLDDHRNLGQPGQSWKPGAVAHRRSAHNRRRFSGPAGAAAPPVPGWKRSVPQAHRRKTESGADTDWAGSNPYRTGNRDVSSAGVRSTLGIRESRPLPRTDRFFGSGRRRVFLHHGYPV